MSFKIGDVVWVDAYGFSSLMFPTTKMLGLIVNIIQKDEVYIAVPRRLSRKTLYDHFILPFQRKQFEVWRASYQDIIEKQDSLKF